MVAAPEVPPRLLMDARFSQQASVLGGRLLDVQATTALWGAPPGRLPEEWMQPEGAGTIGFCPTNWGWQRNAWLFDHQALHGMHQDPSPAAPLWMLGWEPRGGWYESTTQPEPDRMPVLGLEMPRILRSGRPVPLGALLTHQRLVADLRNVLDFAAGRGATLDPQFWITLRRFLPATARAAQTLLEGGSVEVSVEDSAARRETLRAQVSAAGLPGVRMIDDKVVFEGPLPKARLPLFALGAQPGGALVVVAVDGRQPGLPGATIEEAAELLREHGASCGGLGSAGGDVCLVERTVEGSRYLNRPSTPGMGPNSGISRPVPSLILL